MNTKIFPRVVLAIVTLIVLILAISTIRSCRRVDPQPQPKPVPVNPQPWRPFKPRPAPQPTPSPVKPAPNKPSDPVVPPAPELLDGKVSRIQAADRLWIGRRLRAKRIKIADIVGPAGIYAAEAKRFVESVMKEDSQITVTIRSSKDKIIIGDVLLSNGKDLAKVIVEAGWAQASDGASYQLKSLEKAAKSKKLGIWRDGESVQLAPEITPESWGAEPAE